MKVVVVVVVVFFCYIQMEGGLVREEP